MATSILDTQKGKCFLCGVQGTTEEHHVFGGVANRPLSEKDGLKVYLCWNCHHMRIHGTDTEAQEFLKKKAQRAWMTFYGKGTSDFVRRYGKNYLDYWE